MQNAMLDETQAGIKIAGRNINKLEYADDTSLMTDSKEEVKSLLMKVKEESEKSDLKLNIHKTKIMASSPIISWQIDGEKAETLGLWALKLLQMVISFLGLQNFLPLGSKITADGDCSHAIKRCLLLGRKL